MTRIPLLTIVAKSKDFPRIGGRTPFSLHPLVAARMEQTQKDESK
jgi:hypothetical protein